MRLAFTGELFPWRGPAPFHFVAVPEPESERLREVAAEVSYGWGMIPVAGRIGETTFTTALWPKDGRYLVPVKDKVRRAEELELGDQVTVELTVDV